MIYNTAKSDISHIKVKNIKCSFRGKLVKLMPLICFSFLIFNIISLVRKKQMFSKHKNYFFYYYLNFKLIIVLVLS